MTLRKLPSIVVLFLPLLIIACDSGQGGPTAPTASRDSAAGSGTRTGAIADPGLPQDVVTLKMTAPTPTAPDDGVVATDPAITLRVSNAQAEYLSDPVATQVRFEVWTIPPGASPVVTRAKASGGTATSFAIPDGSLQDDTLYVWRARAELDGNVGPWSTTYSFATQFVKIGVPVLTDPINNKVVSSVRPVFTVLNPEVTGDAGTVLLEVEVSTNSGFSNVIEIARVEARARGETNLPLQNDLQFDRVYFWRARGTNQNLPVTAVLPDPVAGGGEGGVSTVLELVSDWSDVETFRTPTEEAAAPPPPSGGGGGGGGGGSGSSPGAPFTTPGGNPPNMLHIVQQVASANPGALANSCQEHGGSWQFMDMVVETMRGIDGRWAYNCKRGNCGDVSLDVIDYYRGSGSAQGSTDVAIIDIILGHCGSNPQPAWIDQTDETAEAGSVGRWKYPR